VGSDKNIGDIIGSNKLHSITDDRPKDNIQANWIEERLVGDERLLWEMKLRGIRWLDRGYEGTILGRSASYSSEQIRKYFENWIYNGVVPDHAPPDLTEMFGVLQRERNDEQLSTEDLRWWIIFADALKHYTKPDLVIRDMDEYIDVMYKLGCFHYILPHTPKNAAVGAYGAENQHLNTWRDMDEDIRNGNWYFPDDLTRRFGVRRKKYDKGFAQMVEHVDEEFESYIRGKVVPLLSLPDLHPSWRILIEQNDKMYARIRRVLKEVAYDPRQFNLKFYSQV
jgi:hypothetical protein